MKKLLAMGVVGDWVGDWHRVRGNERGVVAYPVADDERVWLEVETERGTIFLVPLSAVEPTPIKVGLWVRYRVVKRSGLIGSAPTTVEITLNGAAHSSNRNTDDPAVGVE